MNNVFLYANRDSKTYREVEEYLAKVSFNGKLIVLPPGSQFSSPLCLQLRSNDVIILFAENEEDIHALLALHDEYESFRIIVIVQNEKQATDNRLSIFSPRLIAYLDNGIDNISKYLINIFLKKSQKF